MDGEGQGGLLVRLDAAVQVGRQVGQHFRAGIHAGPLQGLPAGVGVFQIVQIIGAVHRQQGFTAEIGRRLHRDASGRQRGLQAAGARWQIGGRADAAQPHELARLVQQLFVGEKGLHGVPVSAMPV